VKKAPVVETPEKSEDSAQTDEPVGMYVCDAFVCVCVDCKVKYWY